MEKQNQKLMKYVELYKSKGYIFNTFESMKTMLNKNGKEIKTPHFENGHNDVTKETLDNFI